MHLPAPAGTRVQAIVLLTRSVGADHLAGFLKSHAPNLVVERVKSLADFDALSPAVMRLARLIAFGTDVIVPARLLLAFGYGAYNFHPGSPAYPGWAPYSFAAYDGVRTFGATVHQMVEKVDAGPIVGTEFFSVPPAITGVELYSLALLAMIRLFKRVGPALVTSPAPLPGLPVAWGSRKYTRAAFAALCDMPADIDREEMNRRVRAFALNQPDYPTPTVNYHANLSEPCPTPAGNGAEWSAACCNGAKGIG